ncbi:hypothetical protein [Streptosporangium saharense]|uniref:Uncharacterized protein n=1 Tax=Streptosporangium saharense TaxID=1706840 RepID=A0A7W7QW68_9ACTN|nr:hypothetical protein [Streptosporangium saharense]MBB4920898.1 hypothetical protein [Streptosporangium saharense]
MSKKAQILAALDELHAATKARDGDGAVEAVERLRRTDPEIAASVVEFVVVRGLNRMVNGD